MTVKEYLNRARYLDKEINAKIDHLERIDAMVNRVTPVLSDMPHQPTDNAKREKLLVKMIDLKWEINDAIDELVDTKRDTMKLIGKIDNNSYRLLLELRYVNLCTWEKIAKVMDITERSVYRMHGSARLEAEKIYKKV